MSSVLLYILVINPRVTLAKLIFYTKLKLSYSKF